MPRLVIDKSVFEPIEIEIDGRTFVAVPLSPSFIRAFNVLQDRSTKGELDVLEFTLEAAALMFGVDRKDIEHLDFRVWSPALEFVTSQISSSRRPNPDKHPAEAERRVEEAIKAGTDPKN